MTHNPDDLPFYLTVAEFASLARIAPATAYRLVTAGLIPSRRFGRRLVVPRSALTGPAERDSKLPAGKGRDRR